MWRWQHSQRQSVRCFQRSSWPVWHRASPWQLKQCTGCVAVVVTMVACCHLISPYQDPGNAEYVLCSQVYNKVLLSAMLQHGGARLELAATLLFPTLV